MVERRPYAGWILVSLLAPAVISLCVFWAESRNFEVDGYATLAATSPIAGIVAGFLFAKGLDKRSKGAKVATGFFMAMVFTFAALALACGGCILANLCGVLS